MDPLEDDWTDALYGERVARHVARDSNPEFEDEQFDALPSGTNPSFTNQIMRTFATAAPPFSNRPRPIRTRNPAARPPDGQTPPASARLTRADYWVHSRPTLKSTTWATVTAHLPLIPPSTETTEIKNTVLNSYCQRLHDAEGEWSDKTSLFLSSFEHLVPAASLEADVVLTDFENFGSDVFEFDSFECYNNMYEQVVLGNVATFTNAERTSIRWFKFALTITPRLANVGHLDIQPNKFPSARTNTIFLRALLNNAGTQVHNSVTRNILRNRPSTLPTLYAAQNAPFEPAIKLTDSTFADPARFVRILKQIKAETKFEAVRQIVQPVYVGRIDGLKSLTNRILAVQQSYFDHQTKLRRYSSVNETNQRMQALLQEIDHTNPPRDLPNLEQTFFQGLHENLRIKLVDDLHAGTPTTLGQNLRQYNDIVKLAIAAEEAQKQVAKTIHQIANNLNPSRPQTRSQHRAGGPRVFIATHEDVQYGRERDPPLTATAAAKSSSSQNNKWTNTPSGTRYLIPVCFCASHTGNTIAEEMIAASVEMVETLEDEPADGFAGVSIVEQALRNASGVRRPIKCFGCQGLEQYDSQAYHLWKDCPNKSDQAVWRNFQLNLRRFREEKQRRRDERQPSYYGPSEPKEEKAEATTALGWQRLGFPTKAMSEHIEAIADRETKPTVRRALLATLKIELANTDLKETATETEEYVSPNKSRKKKRGPLFLLYMKNDPDKTAPATRSPIARTMLAASNGKYPLRIAYNLPHIQFPIGDGQTTNDRAFLTGLLDTGGCCMMGRLEWYQELHRICPQLFDDLFELADRKYENINIGGLKDGIWLTHVAVLWMPYEERGATMRVEIGLSNELPVDTLFGVNFQKATKMTINLGENKAESAYLGDSYKLVWRTPSNADIGQIRHEAQRKPMAFITSEYDDDDEAMEKDE